MDGQYIAANAVAASRLETGSRRHLIGGGRHMFEEAGIGPYDDEEEEIGDELEDEDDDFEDDDFDDEDDDLEEDEEEDIDDE